ncbi:MAG: O-antigen ligase family protein [Saprospiraceae bacterium]|nr:O-antigen ligase family protein [Saprospiraceae bacterium]
MNKWVNHQTVGIISILMILIGLLCSEMLMSSGMIILTANAVFNQQIQVNFRIFFQNRVLLGLTAIFGVVLISGLWSSNGDWLADRLRMRLPFLLMPFAVVAIPKFDKKVYFPILASFFWLVIIVCLYSITHFILNYDAMIEGYKQGHVMFTPVMHIRFSLIVAVCIAIGWYLYQEKFYLKYPIEQTLILIASVFLLIYLHILAVRTGLVSLYAALGFFVLHNILKTKRYTLGIGLALMMVIALALAIRFVPTLWNKLGYTLWSLEQIAKGERLADLSDSYRLATIEAGIQLGNKQPLLGTGWGDILDETEAYLQQKYPELLTIIYMPQSEYLLFYAASGIVGLLIFIWASLQPLFYKKAWQNLFICAFHIIMILSFIIEQTIETQLGTAIYIIFAVMNIRFQMESDK